MQNKTTRIIISGLATLLLILAVAGSASAVSFDVDLPSTAAPGETVTGYVWIKDAGAIENNISAYQADLITDAALNLYIDYTLPYLNLSSLTSGGSSANNLTFIAEAYGGNAYGIDSSAEKLCTFKITIPSAASVGTMYTVDFNSTPQRTFLITYTTYYDDGILGHKSSHGSLAKAALTRVNDTITVAVPTYSIGNFTVNGNVTANKTTAPAGAIIHVEATPDTGYHFVSWNVTNSTGGQISVDGSDNFVMPSEDVNAGAVFTPVQSLELVSYNGYVKDKSGNYLKNATTGLNITDTLTGVELAAPGIQTPDNQRFNASIKSEMVYRCGKEASVDGNISVVNQYPKFHSISGANITLETVKVEAFDIAGGSVASSTSASIVDGKLHHDCDLTDPSISYLNITFTGRKLGDVDNNSELTPNDSTEMYMAFVEAIVLTDQDVFYGDTDQTCELTPNDCVVIFQYLVENHMYSWI